MSVLVERGELLGVVEHAAVDAGEEDIVLVGAVDESRVRVVDGHEVRLAHVDGDEVGELAGFERADLIGQPERLGAAERRHAHGLLCVERGDVAFDRAMQEEGRAHLVEHVHDVARGGAVGAQPDAHALVDQIAQRSHAAAGLGVALGAVRHRGALLAQDADIVEARLHAVHGEEVGPEDVPLLQVLDGAHPVGLHEHALPAHLLAEVVGELARAGADERDLVLALGDVARQLDARLAAVARDGLVEAARDGVGGVGGHPDADLRRRLVAQPFEALVHVGQRLVEARVVDAEHLLVDDSPQPGALERLEAAAGVGDVGHGGDARGDGLEDPEQGAAEVLLGRQRGLHVDELQDPVAELLVVHDAAEGGVLDVAVCVDEARHDDGLAEVDELRAGVGGAQLVDPAHGDDAPAVDGHGAALQERRRDREDPVGAIDGRLAHGIPSVRKALRRRPSSRVGRTRLASPRASIG